MTEQRTEEWYKDRLGLLTASVYYDALGTQKNGKFYATRADLIVKLALERVTGNRIDTYVSEAMQNGIDTEELAKLEYTMRTGNKVTDCGFIKHPDFETGASPDGLIGRNTILEIKCPKSTTHLQYLKDKTVPIKYYYQMQAQMWCTGRDKGIFVSFDPLMPENAQLLILEVQADNRLIRSFEVDIPIINNEIQQAVEFIKEYK